MLGFAPLGFLPLGFILISSLAASGGSLVVTTPGGGLDIEIGPAGIVTASVDAFTITPTPGGLSVSLSLSGMKITNA